MFQKIDNVPGNILALKIIGEISDKEYDEICAMLENRIAQGSQMRLFLVVEPYLSFNSAESLYEDLRFVKTYSESIDRVAVLGDRAWEKTWLALFALFSKVQMEHFEKSEVEAATQWLVA